MTDRNFEFSPTAEGTGTDLEEKSGVRDDCQTLPTSPARRSQQFHRSNGSEPADVSDGYYERATDPDANTAVKRIKRLNVCNNETFRYSLPIIKGYVSLNLGNKCVDGAIVLKRLDANDRPDEVTSWPVVDGYFKCLANLNKGRNRFILEYQNTRINLNLEFKPKTTIYHVLPVYIICDGSDGRFQAPVNENNSPESACKRISLGSRLIQTLVAEKLRDIDATGRTFRLARDLDPALDCLVFRTRLRSQHVYNMKPEEIWEHFGRELMSSSYGSDKRKFLAFLSCTRYPVDDKEPESHEEVIARVQGHVALGGGGLAVFGTGCLHTWPETIEQILPKFMDETKVNKLRYMDDSCYRGTYGGCFSTTLGAVCHELGHAFDLGHCKNGIMGRGFDNVNLVFTTVHQKKDSNRNVISRNKGQHSTVCFTRDLNVIYTVSSPTARPRYHLQRSQRVSPQRGIQPEMNSPKKCWSMGNHEGEKKLIDNMQDADDLTFWERSCAVLLRYHKWFSNDDDTQNVTSSIEFDPNRNVIRSKWGIRVVEVRGENGFVLASWEFVNTTIPTQFKLPMLNINVKDIRAIIAEDSSGNILKHHFPVN